MINEQIEPVKKEESFLKKLIRILIPLSLGFFILWFLYKDTDFLELWTKIKDANLSILLFALIWGLIGNIIRGVRWKLLIEPLGYTPSTSNVVYAVLGNYAINLILPRAGEIWRCGVISKYEKIPFVRLLGTLLVDRLFDTIMVASITLLACCFNLDFFLNYLKEHESISASLQQLVTSYIFYAVLFGIVVFLYLIFGVFKNTKIVLKIKDMFRGLISDMGSVLKMNKKGLFLIYTIGIWFCYFLYFYINFYAFDFTENLGVTAGLIAFAISSLSMAIPTNGGVGVWHAAVVLSLGLYGVEKSQSEAFAFGVFALQSSSMLLYGMVSIFLLTIINRKK